MVLTTSALITRLGAVTVAEVTSTAGPAPRLGSDTIEGIAVCVAQRSSGRLAPDVAVFEDTSRLSANLSGFCRWVLA